MENKPLWLRILLDTIGIPSIIAFVVGVPTMIVFIQSIWAGLSTNERISAVVSGTILLILLIIVIYSKTRKVLLVIPSLLQEIQDITFENAMSINAEVNNIGDTYFKKMTQILKIAPSEYTAIDEDAIITKSEILYEKVQDMLASSEQDTNRIMNLLVEYSGLNDRLMKDKKYTATINKLDKVRRLIPNEEIATNVNWYLGAVGVLGSMLPVIQHIETEGYGGIVKMEADFIGIENEIKDGMLVHLARVRQSILQYYKGKSKISG